MRLLTVPWSPHIWTTLIRFCRKCFDPRIKRVRWIFRDTRPGLSKYSTVAVCLTFYASHNLNPHFLGIEIGSFKNIHLNMFGFGLPVEHFGSYFDSFPATYGKRHFSFLTYPFLS